MESFFLAETTKYLYLLFDPDNPLNSNGGSGTIIDTPRGQCLIEAGGYIFNTEAHPVDTSALRCCHDEMRHPLAGYEPDRFGDRFEWNLREKEIRDQDSAIAEENLRKNEEVRNRITSTVIDVEGRMDSTEETRNKIVAEILSVLKENKFNKENTKFPGDEAEATGKVGQPPDDSIILSVPTDEKVTEEEEASTGVGEVVAVDSIENDIITINTPDVAVVKLPPTRDPDDLKSTSNEFVAFEDEETTTTTPSPLTHLSTSPSSSSSNPDIFAKNPNPSEFHQFDSPATDQLLADIAAKENVTNITDFVHSILKSALPAAPRFDAQRLLEKVRFNEAQRQLGSGGRNATQVDYRWLTCRAQPFLHRISVMGEFF